MRIVLITVLGLFLLVNVLGLFLDPSISVERHVVAPRLDVARDVDRQRLFELVNDLEAWKAWAPVMDDDGDHEVSASYSDVTAGVGATCRLEFDGEHAILLMIAKSDPVDGVTVEARMGAVADDLEGGEGFRAWDHVEWAAAEGGGTRITWTRTGQALPLYLLRVWDHFVVAPTVARQLEEGLERLVDVAEEPVPAEPAPAELAPEDAGASSDAPSSSAGGTSSTAGNSASSTDAAR